MLKYKGLKKWTSLFIALLMTVYLATPGFLVSAKAESGTKVFDLIEITDFHGSLEDSSSKPVSGVLAKNIKDIKDANPDRTLIIGGGDLYQGSPVSNVLKGVPVQKVLSSIGMEVTTLGNHEFDWGLDTIINTTMKDAKYSIVCANLYSKATGKRVFEPYKIIEKDGVKIGIIGAITPTTTTIVLPKYIENYEFKDVVAEINGLVSEVKGAGADVVIALIHEGDNLDGKTGPIFDIANKLVGIDALFGGHSHSILNTTVNGMPVYIANNAGKGFIDAKMTVDSSKKVSFTGSYIDIYTDKPNGYKAASPLQNPEVKAIVDSAKAELGPVFSEKIGTASMDLNRIQTAIPYGESYLGNWSADVIRAKAGADVGAQNNGGIRIDVPKGDITVGTIYYIMPFDNELCVINMTKAQLKVILEQAFADGGKGIQISGIKVTYNSAKPSGSRVIDITRENGSAINDTEKLKVATNDFMATGGDGFGGFVDAGGKDPSVNTHVLIRDALIEDVKAKGAITAVLNSRIVNQIKTIAMVATTDIHGNIYPLDYYAGKPADQGLAKVSTYVKNLKKSSPNIILSDCGDTIQGTPLVYYYNMLDITSEYPMMKVMGALGYDTWTLGNHEFNYGLTTLNRIISDAKKNNIHVLSANTRYQDNTNFVEPYIIKEFNLNGKTQKIAVLGLTTKTVPSWENEANYKGLKFNDIVEDAKYWVPIIKSKGADMIIATVHSGVEGAADTIPENQIKALAQGVSGIDAIVAAHTHVVISQDITLKNPDGKTVVLTQPGKYGQNISQIDITVNADGSLGTVAAKTVKMDSAVPADTNITDVVAKPYQDKTMEYINTKLGTAAEQYTGEGQTVKDTAIMDLINMVQKDAAGTQLSIAAPLSASALIPKGDVKIKDIMSVYVYENFLYGIKMTGAQIKAWMEWSVRFYKQASSPSDPVVKDPVLNIADYNLDILYGATYDIDITQKIGSRIKNLKYNGQLIKDTDVFTVAINNYRFNGGGSFMKEAGLTPGDMSIVVYDSAKALGDDGQVRSLMVKYVQDHKTITPTVANNWKVSTSKVTQEGLLPKTGSSVDTGVLIGLGGLVVLLGVALILNDRKKKKDLAA